MNSRSIDTLNLKHIGLLELLFASYPITSGYLLGKIPMTVLMLVIMDILAMFRNYLNTITTIVEKRMHMVIRMKLNFVK